MNTDALERINCPICGQDQTSHLFTKNSLSIVECRNCGLWYVNPRLSARKLESTYTQGYYPKEKIQRTLSNAMEELQMKERLSEINRRHRRAGRLLDVGCGIGTFLHLAEEDGWEVYGIEPSRSGAEFACNQYKLNVFCGNLNEADFPDEYFDAIVLYHVLEHIPEPNPMLAELRRILKPGTGELVIEVPNAGSWGSRLRRDDWPYFHPEDHLYYFSYHTLLKLLSKNGFSRIQSGRPRRVNPHRGLANRAKFIFMKAATSVLIRFHLATVIRVYAGHD